MKLILLVVFTLGLYITGNHFSAKAEMNSSQTMQLGALQAAIDARDSFVLAAQTQDFREVTMQGFGAAIQSLAVELRGRHDDLMANQLLDHWGKAQAIFYSVSFYDLGDHDPLFPWLEDFFTKMSQKYGTIILSLPVVKDLRTLNYAIPVVMQPNGKWMRADVDNRIEYRKHFIPFANIITHYTASFACDYAVKKYGQPILKQLCGPAVDKLTWAMGRYLAPMMADFIFKEANPGLAVYQAHAYYQTARQLQAAVFGNE